MLLLPTFLGQGRIHPHIRLTSERVRHCHGAHPEGKRRAENTEHVFPLTFRSQLPPPVKR